MERWVGKAAVVTGASSGIGAAIAEKLVNEGLLVVGLARRKEKIEELSKQLSGKAGKLFGVSADLAKEDDIVKAFEWVKENVGPVHVLVNCAGIYRISLLSNGDARHWRDALDINVLGLCIATREAIKDMNSNKVDGHIVHINSIGGHRVVSPYGNISGASKYAVTSLTETLRQEFNALGSKIKVTSISPGFVRTNIFETTMVKSGLEMSDDLKNRLKKTCLESEDLANAVAYVLSTPPTVQITELTMLPVGEDY